ncbi:hypothetical protein KQX54_014081 [Cotesia glomerata]|uniref:Uncharacterized protein n=1 Tax=Cotesia glomerata TaxID=32391 RepID=A0AAV7ISJ5_COTGL|nr:hypothetical protein KQX54_014081 [Cotesia glomerata]
MAIKVEHDDVCYSEDANDVKPRLKFNNYAKCGNKCFDIVDKWVNKAIVKVPTGDNWHNIIQREIALLKVRYPFLTEKQLKGKALVKFGIPCSMGNIIRTGEKKVTGTLAEELLKTRERKSRIPAPFKFVKKLNPFIKKLKSSSPSKIEDYLNSTTCEKKFTEMTTVPSTPKKVYRLYGLRNPYYSDTKENSCPSTPKKRKIFDPETYTWTEINDDHQTPIKKRKLNRGKSSRKKIKYPFSGIGESDDDVACESSPRSEGGWSQSSIRRELVEKLNKYPFVKLDECNEDNASPSKSSPRSEGGWSESSIRRELVQKLNKYPFAKLGECNDDKHENEFEDSEEVLQEKSSQKILPSLEASKINDSEALTEFIPTQGSSQSQGNLTYDIITPSPNIEEYLPTPINSQSQKDSIIDINNIEISPPSQSIASQDYFYPAGQKYREPVSLSEFNSVRRSFERLSFNESDSEIPSGGFSQCSSIDSKEPFPTPIFNRFFSSLDHDYAKINDTQLLTPFLDSPINSQAGPVERSGFKNDPLDLSKKFEVEIFTPLSQSSQFSFFPTPIFPKSFGENEFSDSSESSPVKLLSNCCDELSEGWKKVPPSFIVPASTDISEKLKTVSMKEIKEQVRGVINFLDGA